MKFNQTLSEIKAEELRKYDPTSLDRIPTRDDNPNYLKKIKYLGIIHEKVSGDAAFLDDYRF